MQKIHCIIETLDPVYTINCNSVKPAGVHGIYTDIWSLDKQLQIKLDNIKHNKDNYLCKIITNRGYKIQQYTWINQTFYVHVQREIWMVSVPVIFVGAKMPRAISYWVHFDERNYQYLTDADRAIHNYNELELFDLYVWAFYMNINMNYLINKNQSLEKIYEIILTFKKKYYERIIAVERRFQKMVRDMVMQSSRFTHMNQQNKITWNYPTLYTIDHINNLLTHKAICYMCNENICTSVHIINYHPYTTWDINQHIISEFLQQCGYNVRQEDVMICQYGTKNKCAKIIANYQINKYVEPSVLLQ
jgi:hypothetical protein